MHGVVSEGIIDETMLLMSSGSKNCSVMECLWGLC